MRVTVSMIVNQLGAGRDVYDLLREHRYLEADDIRQALRYAAWLADGREFALADEACGSI
jgi:uncharacterized protein (DUF433 family)